MDLIVYNEVAIYAIVQQPNRPEYLSNFTAS